MAGGFTQDVAAGGFQYLGSAGGAGLTVAQLQQSAVAAIGALASDGSDGDVTITGGTTTLARDMYYNNLTVDGTGILITRGWRVYARSVTVLASGVLHADGADAVTSTGGAAFATGSVTANYAGANGGTGVGAAGTANQNSLLPRSGVFGTVFKGAPGGLGSSGAGGAGGGINASTLGRQPRSGNGLTAGGYHTAGGAASGGGSGGGAGGGDGVGSGGGGGAGGGMVAIVAGSVSNLGTIAARGGVGGAGGGTNCGGGGGGGGGIVQIQCGAYSGNLPIVTGGAGGAKTGTGVAGSTADPGDYFIEQFKAA
jgi:hypothetical protein